MIFLSCKANSRVFDAKLGHGPHSSPPGAAAPPSSHFGLAWPFSLFVEVDREGASESGLACLFKLLLSRSVCGLVYRQKKESCEVKQN